MKSLFYFALMLIFSVSFAHAATLTLQEALSMRTAGSRSLKMASIDEQIAADTVRASRSGYLPHVDIQGGYTAQQAPQSISGPFGSF